MDRILDVLGGAVASYPGLRAIGGGAGGSVLVVFAEA